MKKTDFTQNVNHSEINDGVRIDTGDNAKYIYPAEYRNELLKRSRKRLPNHEIRSSLERRSLELQRQVLNTIGYLKNGGPEALEKKLKYEEDVQKIKKNEFLPLTEHKKFILRHADKK